MLAVTIIAIILSGFFSGMEIAFVSGSHVRASLDAQKGGLVNRIVNMFYAHSAMVISTLLVGNNIMLVIYGIGTASLLEPVLQYFTDNEAVILAFQTLISTLIIIITGEYIPKSIFRINPNSSMRAFSIVLLFFYYLLYPISWFTSWISRVTLRMFGVKAAEKNVNGLTVDELEQYIEDNIERKQAGGDEEVEHEVRIFHNALDFADTHLRDCMIPRNEMTAVDIDNTDRDTLCNLFISTGLSKIAVYRNDIDNVIGYIHVSELFREDVDWRERLKTVLYAPETMLAKKMLQSLLSKKKSMAIVIDEFGGTAGLVTLEDLVEEICGDFEDEHDHKQTMAVKIADGVFDFNGRAEIDKINELYHLDLPESDDYQTLAGLFMSKFGAMPEVGESLELDDVTLTLQKRNNTRLESIRVTAKDKNVQ